MVEISSVMYVTEIPNFSKKVKSQGHMVQLKFQIKADLVVTFWQQSLHRLTNRCNNIMASNCSQYYQYMQIKKVWTCVVSIVNIQPPELSVSTTISAINKIWQKAARCIIQQATVKLNNMTDMTDLHVIPWWELKYTDFATFIVLSATLHIWSHSRTYNKVCCNV